MRWRDRPKSVEDLIEADGNDNVVRMLLDWVPTKGTYCSMEKEVVTHEDRMNILNYYHKNCENRIIDDLDDY